MKIGIILFAVVIVIAGLLLLGVYLKKKGIFDDKDNNNIPDFADKAADKAIAKAKAIKKETSSRIAAIKKEAGDVVDTIKEVGNQIGDIPKAAAGKKRPGKKEKK